MPWYEASPDASGSEMRKVEKALGRECGRSLRARSLATPLA